MNVIDRGSGLDFNILNRLESDAVRKRRLDFFNCVLAISTDFPF